MFRERPVNWLERVGKTVWGTQTVSVAVLRLALCSGDRQLKWNIATHSFYVVCCFTQQHLSN